MKSFLSAVTMILVLGCSNPPSTWELRSADHGAFRTESIAVKAHEVDGFPEMTELEVICAHIRGLRSSVGTFGVTISAESFIYDRYEREDVAVQIVWDSDFTDVTIWDVQYVETTGLIIFSPASLQENDYNEVVVSKLPQFSDMEFKVATPGKQRVAKFRLDGFADAFPPVAAYCQQ